jgi:hypothetical protein
MNTSFIKNRGGKIIEKNLKTNSVHASFSDMNKNEKSAILEVLTKKYRKVVNLDSPFDDDLSVLIFLK